jgi:formate transporter
MQSPTYIEKLFKEKIENLLAQESLKHNKRDISSLERAFFEIQMMALQLYPNNQTLQNILKRQDYVIDKRGFAVIPGMDDAAVILDKVREIALVAGLDLALHNNVINTDSKILENQIITKPPIPENGHDTSDSLTPRDTAKKVEERELEKANMNTFSVFVLAILAGAFIALGGIYFTFATSQVIVTRPLTQILGGMVFSVGLMFVVITGAQLFTGNNLGVMGLVSKRISVAKLIKNWTIVYIGNIVGALATAAVFYMSDAWTNNSYQYGIRALMIASHKVSLNFVEAFFLGILCNCLVCMGIWLATSGKKVSDKILAVIFPISAFVAIGFEHSVANMYFLSFALMIKNNPFLLSSMNTAGITVDISHLNYFGVLGNLLPVTLGNIVGGSIFVGLVYWLAYLRNTRKGD